MKSMHPSLPFTPPDKSPCMALYHPQQNAWWLVMGCNHDPGLPAWKHAIKTSGGTIKDHWSMESSLAYTGWKHLQKTARALETEGFLRIVGNLKEISPDGTRWLRSNPKSWWSMHSASKEQLAIIQMQPEGSDLVLTALARQGYFGPSAPSGKSGPSVVEHRWKEFFPEEVAFAQHCRGLGLTFKDAMVLWANTKLPQDAPQEIDLGAILDLR